MDVQLQCSSEVLECNAVLFCLTTTFLVLKCKRQGYDITSQYCLTHESWCLLIVI